VRINAKRPWNLGFESQNLRSKSLSIARTLSIGTFKVLAIFFCLVPLLILAILLESAVYFNHQPWR
jgi:hypothetical protein